MTHSMTKLSQFFQDFSLDHYVVIDRVISYFYETKNLAIKYFEKRFWNIFLIASDAIFVIEKSFQNNSNEYFF